jgi:hypothetical protein
VLLPALSYIAVVPERACSSVSYHIQKRERFAMSEQKRKPDPAKVAFLRSLPVEVKESITGEEADMFMFGTEIPESLYHKIKDYLVESSD